MKKIVLFLILFVYINADLTDAKIKLIQTISWLVFNDNKTIVYIQSPEYSEAKKAKDKLNISLDCENADMLILSNYKSISNKCLDHDPVVFVTNYSAFKKNPNSLGTVFWQKGRLNIIFRESKLKDLSISLPKNYDKYIE